MHPTTMPADALQMQVRRIPAQAFDNAKGPLAGVPTTLWTKGGMPVCARLDEEGLQAADPRQGELEPLPDRMIAIHWRDAPCSQFWIGIGDGWAVPLPAGMPLVPAPHLISARSVVGLLNVIEGTREADQFEALAITRAVAAWIGVPEEQIERDLKRRLPEEQG